ncbi:class I SAM-dependent methyltransferase [Curtobacterium sp. MWU13-2055]|uniref:class I SAM-dependent methyltransferase n=1 Tax=Curtobacterium sp. MWU13-2055 TaxID=2931928 RepID=UPI00200EF1CE|nr:class I SAM-dependent methyltransferase [Curtobacterium sp. MWU13-2055]
MDLDVTAAYGDRAGEYAELLGSMSAVHDEDRTQVEAWASGSGARILDAGCGPGHWAAHLADRGHAVIGIDAVAPFVEHARRAHDGVDFRLGAIESTGLDDGSVDGVLAWYSVIHHDPSCVGEVFAEFRRVLRPGGGLLVGFFEGPWIESFDHAVVTAYRWPTSALAEVLDDHGFDVVDVRVRVDPGRRPHAAVRATRR